MPESRQERVLASFARWLAGDRTPLLNEFHPDVEIHTAFGDAFSGRPFRGHEGVGQWMAALDENFERWDLLVDSVAERDGELVVRGRISARARASGLEMDQAVNWIFRFQDDLVIYMRSWFGSAEEPSDVE